MIKELLNIDIQQFIFNNLHEDPTKLILKGSPFSKIKIQNIVEQIVAKKKCEKKLPTWFNTDNIYYPNQLKIEQTSSEITAKYKANLISGNSLIDITGGFGVDSYYFAKKIKNVIHSEIDAELSKIVKYNYSKLQIRNIKTVAQNGLDYLESTNKRYDWIYADPSRRGKNKEKVFLLGDCQPNIPKYLDYLFQFTPNILLKLSPLLDIKSSINELHSVEGIHVVAVNNDVKELLFLLRKGYKNKISIKTINIRSEQNQIFESTINSSLQPTFSNSGSYLYEPNSSILKAGLFNDVSHQLMIDKLHNNSHLYTSDKLIEFPGRRFKIDQIIAFNKKKLKKILPAQKANITIRNFPETVANIRKRIGIKEGGEVYLFFTTNLSNKHIIIICSKI